MEALRFVGEIPELREMFGNLLATAIDADTAKNAATMPIDAATKAHFFMNTACYKAVHPPPGTPPTRHSLAPDPSGGSTNPEPHHCACRDPEHRKPGGKSGLRVLTGPSGVVAAEHDAAVIGTPGSSNSHVGDVREDDFFE